LRSRIFIKIVGAALVVIAVATATMDLSVRRAWVSSLRQQIERGLSQKTALFAQRVRRVDNPELPTMVREVAAAAAARATVIDRGGKVLADSEAEPATMENHATRPEFAAALAGHGGTDTRLSHTLGIEFLYVAAPVEGGAVRLAYPLSTIREVTAEAQRELLKASAVAALLALLLAGLAAQVISKRLQRIIEFAERVQAGDLSARIQESSYDEIAQVASALDTTARRLEENFGALENSRRQLETLLNSMEDAVAAVGRDSRLLWANGALERMLSEPPRYGEPLVATLRDPELLGAVRAALESGVQRHTKARSLRPGHTYDVTVAPMAGLGVVAVLHDVTEVERVERTRRDFIANVSHELRTPLTSIQGYAETLLDAGGDGNTREFLETICKNTARMSRLTEDLLTLARVESGELKLELDAVQPAEILEDARKSLADRGRERGVELEIANEASAAVLADRDAIHQVMTNLIDNALKYAPAGRLILGARQIAADEEVEFYVRDNGPGIASEHLPRLFERFYRVDKARSRDSGGTGLGLAIVKHIVMNHGGTVRVESELGHGSTFIFSLPLAPVGEAVAG